MYLYTLCLAPRHRHRHFGQGNIRVLSKMKNNPLFLSQHATADTSMLHLLVSSLHYPFLLLSFKLPKINTVEFQSESERYHADDKLLPVFYSHCIVHQIWSILSRWVTDLGARAYKAHIYHFAGFNFFCRFDVDAGLQSFSLLTVTGSLAALLSGLFIFASSDLIVVRQITITFYCTNLRQYAIVN